MATSGPDTLIGTNGANIISGLAGDDVIYGMGGASQSPVAGRINVERVGTGFGGALYASSAPGDPDHLYVVTKAGGVIRKLDPSNGSSVPFLNIPTNQFSTDGERGVLSLAFHRDYATVNDPHHGLFYVYLTNPSGDIEVREYDADSGPNAGPVRTIITIPHSAQNNHNGGTLAFGPNDGYLYISTGDGGGANDPDNNAQNTTNVLLGKILRIDINGDDFPLDSGKNYAIPGSNPFVAQAGDDEIWAFGLRNPFRVSFDTNGDLYIGDVGQGAREEIDFQPFNAAGGRNYGWDLVEGTLGNPPNDAVAPIFEYDHTLGHVVTGGVVYRGSGPSLAGAYLFIDFDSNRFWTLREVNGVAIAVADRTEQLFSPDALVENIASFGQDGHGNVYMVGLGGDIFRIDATAFADDLADKLHGGPGNDKLFGGPGADLLTGDGDNDILSGGYGRDLLLGGAGRDLLNGGPGIDAMSGGPGNDVYLVNMPSDQVAEAAGAGHDIVVTTVSFALPANVESLRLIGTAPIDGTGNAGANALFGNARGNDLSGGAGGDFFNGQLGPDRLTGGAGPDVFVFGTALGHGNVDQLVDFAPADTIDLYHAVFHGLPHGHLAASAFFVGASAHDANDRIVYNRATGALLFDANGSTPGGAIPFATVLNHAALTAADFFVI